MEFIVELIDYIRFRRELWRLRNVPYAPDEYRRAVEETQGMFPHDPELQRIDAMVEMDMRAILGRRRHDA